MHHQAGSLIRRLHDSAAGVPAVNLAQDMSERLDRWLHRVPGVVVARDQQMVEEQVAGIADLPPQELVPCHLDNQPRNWLVDDRGTLRLIDFGLTRPDVWVRDLLRLHYRDWDGAPEPALAVRGVAELAVPSEQAGVGSSGVHQGRGRPWHQ